MLDREEEDHVPAYTWLAYPWLNGCHHARVIDPVAFK